VIPYGARVGRWRRLTACRRIFNGGRALKARGGGGWTLHGWSPSCRRPRRHFIFRAKLLSPPVTTKASPPTKIDVALGGGAPVSRPSHRGRHGVAGAPTVLERARWCEPKNNVSPPNSYRGRLWRCSQGSQIAISKRCRKL
jgi:hypothetical protein